jgi:RNA polymerase sigma factor (sigma-70 family)
VISQQRVAAGDGVPGVLEAWYGAYGSLCYRVARGIVVDEHLAQDVVQDAFLAVWSGRAGEYDAARGSMEAWLVRITHCKAVDTVRRNQRHAVRNAGPWLFDSLVAENNVEDDAWNAHRRRHLGAALADLNKAQRQVLELAYFGGYSQSEISRLTNTPLGTVKTRTFTALRRLRQSLDLIAVASDEGWRGDLAAVS